MKTKQIEYKKLVSDGSYNNQSYGVVVELEDGDTEQMARERAEYLVDSWFAERGEVPELRQERDRLLWNLHEIQREEIRVKDRVRRLRGLEDRIRDRMGLERFDFTDEIPF